jgi:hypothetical protein
MYGKKTISIRFHNESESDMKLYRLLEDEAGNVTSLASVAKARIRDSYESKGNKEFQEKVVTAVREEIQKSCMQMAGMLISGTNTGYATPTDTADVENGLPKESVEIPQGAFDFLEQ